MSTDVKAASFPTTPAKRVQRAQAPSVFSLEPSLQKGRATTKSGENTALECVTTASGGGSITSSRHPLVDVDP